MVLRHQDLLPLRARDRAEAMTAHIHGSGCRPVLMTLVTQAPLFWFCPDGIRNPWDPIKSPATHALAEREIAKHVKEGF